MAWTWAGLKGYIWEGASEEEAEETLEDQVRDEGSL